MRRSRSVCLVMSSRKITSREASLRKAAFFFKLIPGQSNNIRKPFVVIALALVATGCAHLANVKTTQPGVPRLMVEEEQLQSATEHLARAKHERPSLSLGDDLSAAKLSLNVLERRPDDLSAQRIYNF